VAALFPRLGPVSGLVVSLVPLRFWDPIFLSMDSIERSEIQLVMSVLSLPELPLCDGEVFIVAPCKLSHEVRGIIDAKI
jgi:hypothetical protein